MKLQAGIMGSCSRAIIVPSPVNKGQATFYDVDFVQEGISLCPGKGLYQCWAGISFLKYPPILDFTKNPKKDPVLMTNLYFFFLVDVGPGYQKYF
jgi:hypothetical protein